jgi:hypothetical protein
MQKLAGFGIGEFRSMLYLNSYTSMLNKKRRHRERSSGDNQRPFPIVPGKAGGPRIRGQNLAIAEHNNSWRNCYAGHSRVRIRLTWL